MKLTIYPPVDDTKYTLNTVGAMRIRMKALTFRGPIISQVIARTLDKILPETEAIRVFKYHFCQIEIITDNWN